MSARTTRTMWTENLRTARCLACHLRFRHRSMSRSLPSASVAGRLLCVGATPVPIRVGVCGHRSHRSHVTTCSYRSLMRYLIASNTENPTRSLKSWTERQHAHTRTRARPSGNVHHPASGSGGRVRRRVFEEHEVESGGAPVDIVDRNSHLRRTMHPAPLATPPGRSRWSSSRLTDCSEHGSRTRRSLLHRGSSAWLRSSRER